MDAEFLARVQFALTAGFHFLYPPLSIGLSVMLVIFLGLALKTKEEIYTTISHFLIKVFALSFAVGVATGVVMEFQFGMNWSNFSRFVGDISSALLGAETMVAFFLESTFLAVLVFGWNRISRLAHFVAAVLVSLGAHLSAIWILMLNSWMNTPTGHKIVDTGLGPKAEIADFWQVAFNPSTLERISHTVLGAWLTGGFMVVSIAAYYLLKKQHFDVAKRMMKVSLCFTTVTLLLQAISAHDTAVGVAHHQPAKLAAFEGLFETEPSTPMSLFGIVDEKNKTMKYEITVPSLLSFLVYMDFKTPVAGLDQFPQEDWPPVAPVYYSYRVMLQMFAFMLLAVTAGIWLWRKGKQWDNPWILRYLAIAFIFPQLANQAGWFSCEVGRQPWVVQGLLRRGDAFSKTVPASEMIIGITMFSAIYIVLFVLFAYLLWEKIQHGPENKKFNEKTTEPQPEAL